MTYTFEATERLSLENSFGTIKEANVALHVTVGIHDDGESGWFELYDVATGGDEWHAEGSLSFEDKELVDYDGGSPCPNAFAIAYANTASIRATLRIEAGHSGTGRYEGVRLPCRNPLQQGAASCKNTNYVFSKD